MSALPRFIRQPGPIAKDRIVAVKGRGSAIRFELEPGLLLVEAVRRGFAAHGFASGVVELANVDLAPMAYVMPALSKTLENAAYYSDIFRPSGTTRLSNGAITFGKRDGMPFFHCHALWREADGKECGGHIMPDETFVATRCEVTALGLDGAAFEGAQDGEINFKIFGPVIATPANPDAQDRVVALRLRPNQDFCGALESYCSANGISNAIIRGGVGSTIGVIFDDGRVMKNFATEIFIESGRISPGASGQPEAHVEIGMIDFTGDMARGTLLRGHNPVLMTFELALHVL